jgi:NADH:ubiquinone oxidoreductase subunit F (NADH-binding)
MQTLDSAVATGAPPAHALPRLLSPTPITSLAAHDAHFGSRPNGRPALIAEIERAGLRGHGGAGFPTATKMAAVARGRRRAVVVVNATEGEPMSAKDKATCSVVPHLVLDGAQLAAESVGAREILVCVERTSTRVRSILERAIAERARLGVDTVPTRLMAAPARYVAGEESALVRWLNGGEAKPTFVPPRPFERGVGGRPTLVQNAETMAHIALSARHGAAWFRALGTDTAPGSSLVTLSGAVARPGVYEIAFGHPLTSLLASAGGSLDQAQAVLIGGYFGTWVRASDAASLTLDPESLASVGASFGCGVIVALPHNACGITESAAVARWLANANAGQCGPCVNGLPAIAGAMEALARGDRRGDASAQLTRWMAMVKGRGACKHPDGAVRFVASSLDAFASDIDRHRHGKRCPASATKRVLATPRQEGWR